jgi:hypothetical protein
MQRSSREQIEAARAILLPIADLAVIMGPGAENALRTLLAATAEPTEEEIAPRELDGHEDVFTDEDGDHLVIYDADNTVAIGVQRENGEMGFAVKLDWSFAMMAAGRIRWRAEAIRNRIAKGARREGAQ